MDIEGICNVVPADILVCGEVVERTLIVFAVDCVFVCVVEDGIVAAVEFEVVRMVEEGIVAMAVDSEFVRGSEDG